MFTQEQQDIIDLVLSSESDNKIVAVNAVAGSGKSSTAKGIIEAFKPKKGFYTAFNKSVVEEAKTKFKYKNLDIRTMHSLAYNYSGYTNIQELSYANLPSHLAYNEKTFIINLLDSFFRSNSINFNNYFKSYKKEFIDNDLTYLFEEAKSILSKMINKEIPATYSFLLKITHLKLYNEEINIDYDLMILDECQDVTAVSLEIFKLIKCKKKIILGDTHQNIYNFMGTVNAFTELDNNLLIVKNLTKSFRCNSDIALQVEEFGKNYFNNDFKYIGTELDENNKNNSIVYLVRHNTAIISILSVLIRDNIPFRLMREPKEIFSFVLSLLSASLGKEVYNKQYKHFEIYYKHFKEEESKQKIINTEISEQYRYFDYLLKISDYDEHLEYSIAKIKYFNRERINLFELLKEVEQKQDKNALLTVSTVHTFKGLEADKAVIHNSLITSVRKAQELIDDLNKAIDNGELTSEEKNNIIKSKAQDYIEPYNLYYVALSRAKYELEGNLL